MEGIEMDKSLISVVTVCLNAEKVIEQTIESILKQNYSGFEYIIKDGESKDSTLEIAKKYQDVFKSHNISFRIISEPDDGLYDAMNKAAEVAEGEWIIYINAGDALFDDSVLSKLSSEAVEQYDVIYGDAVLTERGKYKLLKAGSPDCFKFENPICHQASLVKTDVVRKFRFDTKYVIASDFDLFLRIFQSNSYRLKKENMIFCIFLLGGMSRSKVWKREKEFDASRRQNGLKRVSFPHLQMLKISVVEKILRRMAITVLGNCFYTNKRGWYSDKVQLQKYYNQTTD